MSKSDDRLRQAAHDTANWLTAVRGHLDRAGSLPDGPARTSALERARRCLDACVALQERLLAGDRIPRRERVGIHDLIAPVAEAFAATVAAPARFEVGDLPEAYIRVELAPVRDALLNLLTNARRATPDGRIRLEADLVEGGLALRVVDSGLGMDEETLRRCREPGWSGAGSTGLGLDQVRRATAASAGQLEMESAPGQGTTATLTFPRLISGPPRIADVVVVEDDPNVAEVVVELLRGQGLRVDQASDGASAWAAVEDGPPRVLLVDQGLPDTTGVELAKRVRQRTRDVGIVLLTGQRLDRDALVPGVVDEVLPKPVDFDHLGQVLQDALHAQPSRAGGREDRGQA